MERFLLLFPLVCIDKKKERLWCLKFSVDDHVSAIQIQGCSVRVWLSPIDRLVDIIHILPPTPPPLPPTSVWLVDISLPDSDNIPILPGLNGVDTTYIATNNNVLAFKHCQLVVTEVVSARLWHYPRSLALSRTSHPFRTLIGEHPVPFLALIGWHDLSFNFTSDCYDWLTVLTSDPGSLKYAVIFFLFKQNTFIPSGLCLASIPCHT